MPFFDSKSSATQTQNTATDHGRLLAGKGASYTESGSFQIGKGGKYVESGAVDLSNLKLGKGASNTLVFNDPAAAAILADTYARSIETISNQSAEQVGFLAQNNAAQLSELLSTVDTLSENRQTDGESGRQKMFLWLALGGLAIIASVFIWRK